MNSNIIEQKITNMTDRLWSHSPQHVNIWQKKREIHNKVDKENNFKRHTNINSQKNKLQLNKSNSIELKDSSNIQEFNMRIPINKKLSDKYSKK